MVDCVVPVFADNPLVYNLVFVSLYTLGRGSWTGTPWGGVGRGLV